MPATLQALLRQHNFPYTKLYGSSEGTKELGRIVSRADIIYYAAHLLILKEIYGICNTYDDLLPSWLSSLGGVLVDPVNRSGGFRNKIRFVHVLDPLFGTLTDDEKEQARIMTMTDNALLTLRNSGRDAILKAFWGVAGGSINATLRVRDLVDVLLIEPACDHNGTLHHASHRLLENMTEILHVRLGTVCLAGILGGRYYANYLKQLGVTQVTQSA